MAKKIGQISNFTSGIADSPKIGQANSFAFARGFDFRSNPSQLTVNQAAIRQAAGIVADLPMWGEQAGAQIYMYGNTGNMYQQDASNVWTIDHLAPNSQGNGMVYFPEDGYLYYAQNNTLGRKFNAIGSGKYYDGFLESEGGEPTNTNSITFVSASSQYASIASQASLQITLDLSMEAYLKMTSLPTTGQVQTILSKWNQNANQRSYKCDITTSSNSFGDGRDGALVIGSSQTEVPIDANCVGTTGQYTLTTSNEAAGFSSLTLGDRVIIHQTRGTGAGQRQYAIVQGYAAGVLTLQSPLTFSPAHSAVSTDANKAQIKKLKQYTSVTISPGFTYTVKAWDGFKGGIGAFYCNGTFSGVYSASQTGFTGGAVSGQNPYNGATYAFSGEGTGGSSTRVTGSTNNGNGGGGGHHNGNSNNIGIGGGGGGNASAGYRGASGQVAGGFGGNATSSSDATTATFGGGGGGGAGGGSNPAPEQPGGAGGGFMTVWANTFGATASLLNDGQNGNPCIGAVGGGAQATGGAGAGGTTEIHTNTALVMGTNLFSSQGGWGTDHQYQSQFGDGYGSAGVIAIYYATSVSGVSLPAPTTILTSTLSNTDGYVLRLLLSGNGSNTETYTQNITSLIQTGLWQRWAITWQASTSTATFYLNSTVIGTQTGAFTSVFASSARFAVGCSYDGTGTPQDFLNAKADDFRLWNAVRNTGNLVTYNDQVLIGVETNLIAYYKFDNSVTDSQTYTTNATLTATNAPVFTSDVAFSGITTRADQDIHINAAGSTYTLGTSLSEAATDRQTFVPTKEPLKSVQFNINTVGTGNWTVVLHDGLHRQIATMTVLNAQLHTGLYEFIFAQSCRPVRTATYHVHVYSTVGDGKIVSSSLNDMHQTTINTGAYFDTFFQILVNDSLHPMTQFLNFVVIGNERYVATLYAGSVYNPHQLVLPAGYRVRCFSRLNEFIAIGVWKGTSITDTDQGKVFIWDGSSDVFNTSNPNTILDILQGGVNAMQSGAGVLSAIAGYQGKLLNYGGVNQATYYSGGQFQKVTQLPLLASGEFDEVAPGAMCVWQSMLRFAGTLNTNSGTVHQGVYSYGTLNANYPPSLGLDYTLSIGDTTSSMVKIGSLLPAGQSLYVGWQNGNTYGIDKISVTNPPAPTATMELLIADMGRFYQAKTPLVFRIDFLPLVAGQSVTIKYKVDRTPSWTILRTTSTVGATALEAPITKREKEIQLGFDVVTNGIQLTILQSTFESDTNDEAEGIS